MSQRHPGRPKKVGPWPKCKIAECDSTTEGGSKGFCHKHYCYACRGIFDMESGKQLREFQRVASYGAGCLCSVANCGRKARAGGLCHAHWQRQKNGIALSSAVRAKALGTFIKCLLPECSSRATSFGMCGRHADQRKRGILDELGNRLREPYSMGHGRPRKHDKWVGQQGYVQVKAPEGHPHVRQDGSILEHRLVMEQQLGRHLEEWELVHHKDGNRSNNVAENLELLDGRAKRKAGPGHPPGHEFDTAAAAQVLLQQSDLPEALRQQLEVWRRKQQYPERLQPLF